MLLSTVARDEFYFKTRAVLAHQTWAKHEHVIYVVEETEASTARWGGCAHIRPAGDDAPLYKCAEEPSVLLAPGCTDDYWGAAGPCCKYDFAVDWFAPVSPASRRGADVGSSVLRTDVASTRASRESL